MRNLALLALLSFSPLLTANASPVDCSHATTYITKFHCANPDVLKAYQDTENTYRAKRKSFRTHAEKVDLDDQYRTWLSQINSDSEKKAYEPSSVTFIYKMIRDRINELIPTKLIGPTPEHLHGLLQSKLDRLKSMAKDAKRKTYFGTPPQDENPPVCNAIWDNLQRTTVPPFTHFARTLEEKKTLETYIENVSKSNSKQFLKQNPTLKNKKEYLDDFKTALQYRKSQPDAWGTRQDTSHFIFIKPLAPGAKILFRFITVLDHKGEHLSIHADALREQGLFSDLFMDKPSDKFKSFSAHLHALSPERFDIEGLVDDRNAYPAVYAAGILSLDSWVSGWEVSLVSSIESPNIWQLTVSPVWDSTRDRAIMCSFEFIQVHFNPPPKETS